MPVRVTKFLTTVTGDTDDNGGVGRCAQSGYFFGS